MRYILIIGLLLLATVSHAFTISTTLSGMTVSANVVGDNSKDSWRIGNYYSIYAVATIQVIFSGETTVKPYKITWRGIATGNQSQVVQEIRSGITNLLKNSLRQYIIDAIESSNQKQVLDLSGL